MRDLVVREALETMSEEAAERFRELVTQGDEIPYDVRESGNGSPLPQYIPLTERFVRDHAPNLAELDSFGAACAAIESADLAGPYLEELGIAVPAEARRRAELAGVVFLCRLWTDSTDFSLDAERLRTAIAELEAGGDVAEDEIEVVVPLRGLQLPVARLELATATIVRADTVDVPAEARASEGVGAAPWEPTFLAATRASAAEPLDPGAEASSKPDAGARAVESFRRLITALRLYKAGGVSLGPYAWTRSGGGRWRRIATGTGRPRPGGYRLLEEELGDLVVLSRALAYRSTSFGRMGVEARAEPTALARSVSRFEAGLERANVLEALNDYLLAVRFVLEGRGPAQLELGIRVAALCAEPEQRGEIKAVVDRALALERELWSGEPPPVSGDAAPPAEVAAEVEELVRAILKDAACGHLGPDLRATADEILLADGLSLGEGRAEQRGGPEEWEVPPEELDAGDPDLEEIETGELEELPPEVPVAAAEELARRDALSVEGPLPEDELATEEPEYAAGKQEELWMDTGEEEWATPERDQPPQPLKVPEPRGRIRIESRPRFQEENVFSKSQNRQEPLDSPAGETPPANARLTQLLEARPRDRQRTEERVAYLFPRPETTEWNVRELSYDRRRRAELRAS
jgi:hypothetical protein